MRKLISFLSCSLSEVIAHQIIVNSFFRFCLCNDNWQSVGQPQEQNDFGVLDGGDFVDAQPRGCGIYAVGPSFRGGRWGWEK